MLRMLLLRHLTGLVLLGTMTSCCVLGPDRENEMTLYIAPTMVDCMGVGPQQCLLVKKHPDEEWSYFYDSIVGFTYEPGYRYTLLVERKHLRNPPADGSSIEYRLLQILERVAEPAA